MSHCLVAVQSWEKYTEWPHNELDMFKVKGIHMDATYAQRHQLLSVSLYDGPPFEEIEMFEFPIEYNVKTKCLKVF